jgi:hypothetical protein
MKAKTKIILCPIWDIFDVELDTALKIMRRTISCEKIENSFLYGAIRCLPLILRICPNITGINTIRIRLFIMANTGRSML